jgi:hypothetical protein
MKILFILCVLLAFNVRAQTTDTGEATKIEKDFPGGELTMNGYKLSDFGNFPQTWKMVTVRYREDTKEMRITYANEIAYEHLTKKKGEMPYPDGAVFAKIGITTTPDPLFVSSVVPNKAKRFQFMVHDQKKFAETGGWGYALFNSEGKTYPGEVHKNSEACHACHLAAESRAYIFSEPASFNTKLEPVEALKKSEEAALKFENTKVKSFVKKLRKYFDKRFVEADVYRGEMTKKYFQGTLDEILPTLIERSVKNKKPALFLSDDKKEFSLVQSFIDKKKCTNSDEPLRVIIHQTMTVPEKKNSSRLIYKVIQKESCRADIT